MTPCSPLADLSSSLMSLYSSERCGMYSPSGCCLKDSRAAFPAFSMSHSARFSRLLQQAVSLTECSAALTCSVP